MSGELRERQQQLMAYLLGQDDSIAEHIADQGGIKTDVRLGIYRNAYRIRLRETIDVDHPVLGTYLGDELFDRMVDCYIDQYPSSFSSLRQFADRLPEFLATSAPFSEHPQIAELARFERILLTAFDAADATPVPPEQLAEISAEHWPGLRMRFHPSVQLFCTPWNVVEIWQAIKAEKTPPSALSKSSTASSTSKSSSTASSTSTTSTTEVKTAHWLVWRNSERLTEFRSIESAELLLLQNVLIGHNFAELCEDLLAYVDEAYVAKLLVNTLTQWLQQGLIQHLD